MVKAQVGSIQSTQKYTGKRGSLERRVPEGYQHLWGSAVSFPAVGNTPKTPGRHRIEEKGMYRIEERGTQLEGQGLTLESVRPPQALQRILVKAGVSQSVSQSVVAQRHWGDGLWSQIAPIETPSSV